MPFTKKKDAYQPCLKHLDRELILRAFAFQQKGNNFKPTLKHFLNRELDGTDADTLERSGSRESKRIQDKVKMQRKDFQKVMVAREMFGAAGAFRKWDPNTRAYTSGAVSFPLWDAGYAALAEFLAQTSPVECSRAQTQIVQALQQSHTNGFFANDSNMKGASVKKFIARKRAFLQCLHDGMEQSGKNRNARRVFPPSRHRPLIGKAKNISRPN